MFYCTIFFFLVAYDLYIPGIVSLLFCVFMPPTLKKLEGHIAFGLSVCVSVCLSVCVCVNF